MQLVGFGMAVWHVQENSIHFSGLHHMVGLGTLFCGKRCVGVFWMCAVTVPFFSMKFG